jgi:hypothetical protein
LGICYEKRNPPGGLVKILIVYREKGEIRFATVNDGDLVPDSYQVLAVWSEKAEETEK